jgi:hypothetical protein
MCGRKKKFGLNMMGTVDFLGRFLDVQIAHPGSTSDYLAFSTSNLKALLEKPNFLAPGLVIFGDNAYPNTDYMVTPYRGSRGETHDAFNYYHSQLRIQVECAFGKLVHCFGILRRAIPMALGLRKTSALVSALCRLHNFCTDAYNNHASSAAEGSLPEPLEQDQAFATMNSGIELRETAMNRYEPSGLLHGGEHSHDVSRNIRRRERRRIEGNGPPSTRKVLPQQKLHDLVTNQGLRRPTPRDW